MITRRHLAGLAVGVALALSSPVLAQTAAPAAAPALAPSHLQAARELIDLTGVTSSLDGIYKEFGERTRQIVGVTRPEMIKDMNEVIAALKPEADKKDAEITAQAAEIFARKMPEADLKEVLSFFKSPVGKRYNEARPQAIEELYAKLEVWSLQTSNYLFDRFMLEMRKRGHQM
jgi:hypothetical protein